MNVVAVLGQKGGTGKTTITAAMAVAGAMAGRSVAVIDLDPQTNIADWGDQRNQQGKEDVTVISCQPGRLNHVLKTAEENGVDLVIIDTAGTAAEPAIAAARAAASSKSHLCIVPLQTHMFDIRTLKAVKDVLMIGGNPRAVVVVSQAYSKGIRHIVAAEGVSEKGFDVCPTVIHKLVGHGDPGNVGLTSLDVDPKGDAAKEMLNLYAYIDTNLCAYSTINA